MRKILRKVKLIITVVLINIASFFLTIGANKRVAIVTCDKYKNKVLEDIRLKYYLSKVKIKAKIVSFESDKFDNYDAVIIRSVWGFSKKQFEEWLNTISKKNIKIFNDIDLIKHNFSKKEQFELLDRYKIKHIPTEYISNDKDIKKNLENCIKNGNIVVKPHISESGANTYLLPKNDKISNSLSIDEFLEKKIDTDIFLVQSFMNIDEGEISVIAINGKITHIVKRFPGILGSSKRTIEFKTNDTKLIRIAESIIKVKEYSNQLYMRIDFIKQDSEYLVLEVELIDPMLFMNVIDNKKQREEIYYVLSESIKERI